MWWAVFAAGGAAAWALHSWRVALLDLLGWCLYQFVLVPTLCRVVTREGHSCRERARGRLFACGPRHQWLKTDALWRLAGLRSPAAKRAAATKRPPNSAGERPAERDTGVLLISPPVRGRLALTDRVLVLLAAAGTVVTLAGMVYGLR